MNRSLIFSSGLALVCGLAGCRAQGESRALKEAVTKLERQMKEVDRYLDERERDAKQQAKRRSEELAAKELELQQLRRALQGKTDELVGARAEMNQRVTALEALVAAEQQRAAAQADAAKKDMRAQLDAVTKDLTAKHQAERRAAQDARALAERSRKVGEQAQQEILDLQAKLAEATKRSSVFEAQIFASKTASEKAAQRLTALEQELAAAWKKVPDPQRDLDRLEAERAKVRELRAAVEQDLQRAKPARTEPADPASDRLRIENDALKQKIRALEARGSAAPGHQATNAKRSDGVGDERTLQLHGGGGTVIIHADSGTVHVHIGGTPAKADAKPRAAPPPQRVRLLPPANQRKAQGADQGAAKPSPSAPPAGGVER